MGSIESLNDGQRAVLQLLLRQGKSYADIGGLLRTETSSIRSRARGAVAALAPAGADLGPDRRNEIADYLLGQQTASQRAATREYLEASAPGRSWARGASTALAAVAGADRLPDVPAEREEVAEAFGALDARAARQEEVQRAAKRGGWLISAGLGLLLAFVIIGVVAIVSSGGGDKKSSDSAVATTPSTTATTAANGTAAAEGTPQIKADGKLQPPARSGSGASGEVAIILFPKSKRIRLAMTAKGLPPSSASGSAYGVWLVTSSRKGLFLGFPDKVVGPDGRLDTVADLSPDLPTPAAVLLTTERSNKPKQPGTIVLSAPLSYRSKQTQTQPRARTTTTP